MNVFNGNGKNSQRIRRGASILAAAFTTGNLFMGFWSLVEMFNGRFDKAGLLIMGAIVLDVLDGRIARMTGTASDFGAELDSLADAVSFGVAPAMLVYTWGFSPVAPAGWLVAFLFTMSGVLRLARFNVQRKSHDKRFFVGLPIPGAAGQIAAIVYFFPQVIVNKPLSMGIMALTVILAFLMVSTVRYPSFKGVDLKRRRSYVTILGIALVFLLVASPIHPWFLLCMSVVYSGSGPVLYLVSLLRRKSTSVKPEPIATPAP
ncbi:MAG: CDP-diacylglycerol--serine O-phosphatidyltransferase [Vicinamibacteria bacterium]|nr:CDP-diacylglycerol--serine O-phosphatidyltransferase [Vicinamibacteria bacterium]